MLDDLDAGPRPIRPRARRYAQSLPLGRGSDAPALPASSFPNRTTAAKPFPLVVALHGMGGDENSMFDSYGGTLKREAARMGFAGGVSQGPRHGFHVSRLRRTGRDGRAGRGAPGLQNRLQAHLPDGPLDGRVRHLERGHGPSRRIRGTRSHLRRRQPRGYGEDQPDSGIRGSRRRRPHGPVTQSRTMVEAGRKAGAHIVYVEVPGGSHTGVAAPQMGPMLDFFKTQAKR